MALVTPSMRLYQLAGEQRPISASMLESARQTDLLRKGHQAGSLGASSLEAPGLAQPGGADGAGEAGRSFVQTLKDAVESVNLQQVQSDDTAARFAAGQVEDVHDAMISLEKASLSFKFMVEVRNKLLDGYQEIMRMQV
ncbi:MAG: flagellar hook-basal body complex protein FliE [Candidatus Delongbacteria bacterium]